MAQVASETAEKGDDEEEEKSCRWKGAWRAEVVTGVSRCEGEDVSGGGPDDDLITITWNKLPRQAAIGRRQQDDGKMGLCIKRLGF
jgi:hypothetical protein